MVGNGTVEERKGEEVRWREEEGTPRVGSHPMSQILKIPRLQN